MASFPMFITSLLLMPILVNATEPRSPGLGKPVNERLLEPWELSISASGENLPPGRGSVLQGQQIFVQQCQSCHGLEGRGASAEELSGGRLPLTLEPPDKTIGTYWPYAPTLFDYIRRAMPMNAPWSLSNDQTYALTAYLLHINDILPDGAVLDADSLGRVEMPNREGFEFYWPDPDER